MKSVHSHYLNLALLFALLLSVTTFCSAQPGGLSSPSGFPGTVRYTIVPGHSTPVYLKVLPDAVCELRHRGENGNEQDDAEDSGPGSATVSDSDTPDTTAGRLR